MSTFPVRQFTAKPLMTKEQHIMVLSGLKKRKYREVSLKLLCMFRMNEEYIEEVEDIEDKMADLVDSAYSEIVDWIWRQWQNSVISDKPKVEPSHMEVKRLIVKERTRKPHFSKKSESLRLTHLRRLMNIKKDANPKDYERERTIERIQQTVNENRFGCSFMNSEFSSFADLFAPPPSSVSSDGQMRGKKRSHQQGY